MRVSVNTRAAEAKLNKLSRSINQSAILDEIGRRLLAWSQENVSQRGTEKKWRPFKGAGSQLQTLRGSFTVKKSGNSVTVWNTRGSVAAYHHFGVPKHIIKAKGKNLRFEVGGETVFAGQVEHPGLPARRLLPSKGRGRRIAREVVEIAAIKGGATK